LPEPHRARRNSPQVSWRTGAGPFEHAHVGGADAGGHREEQRGQPPVNRSAPPCPPRLEGLRLRGVTLGGLMWSFAATLRERLDQSWSSVGSADRFEPRWE